MASSWIETTLGEVLTLQRGFDLPETEREPGPFPVIASTGPVGTHNRAMVKGPGVVIGRSGSLGGGQFITSDFWPLNTTLWVKDFRQNDKRFCYYLLKSLNLGHFNAGSGVPTLNRNHIHPLPVRVPTDATEQRAIALILGTLDDKIELNQRMHETLEAIVQAIFRSWFVEFSPVRAKAEGREPGLPKPLADVFPDSFEGSHLGDIPKGWRTGTVGDIAENPRRAVQPQKIVPSTPYIALEHMPRRSIALSEWGYADGLESNKFEFRRGEILFGKLRPYFHKVGVAPMDGVCSTDILVIAPTEPEWFGFLLCYLSSPDFVEYTNAASTGTKMPRTSWQDMARYEVVLPSPTAAAAFNTRVQPLVDRIIMGIHESRTLAALRDTLLPKLISGTLRLKDAKRIFGGASDGRV